MNIIERIERLLSSKPAHEVEHFLVSFGAVALRVAATSPLGSAILAAIKAGEAGTGAVQKIGLAIESLTPTILSYATKGGLAAVETDAETVARLAIEQVLAQVKATGPLAIVEQLERAALGQPAAA